MPKDGQYDGPKHATCIDETNNIFCGWRYAFVSFLTAFFKCRGLSTYQYHLLREEPQSAGTCASVISDSKFASP